MMQRAASVSLRAPLLSLDLPPSMCLGWVLPLLLPLLPPPPPNFKTSPQDCAWACLVLLLLLLVSKLLAPAFGSALDAGSRAAGAACPGCLPAWDACCCLDAAGAGVPRAVQREGRVQLRYLGWSEGAAAAPPVLPGGGVITLPRDQQGAHQHGHGGAARVTTQQHSSG